jgi:outer membrane protein OmpA-like peptidoglycan-associated protein
MRCLVSEQIEGERNKAGISKPFVLVLLAALAVAGWFALHLWQDHQSGKQRNAAYNELIERIGNTPGYVLTSISRDGERLRLQGMSDPLAAPPETLLAHSELTSDQVEMRWRPYHSAEPAIALTRARQRLSPPATVTLDWSEQGQLSIHGVAERPWIERAALLATTIPGVAQLDMTDLQSSDAALEAIARERLELPPDVRLRARSGILEIAGTAPAAWIAAIPEQLRDVALLKELDLSSLQAQERRELQELRRIVESTRLMFAAGSAELRPHAEDQLRQLAARLRQASQLAAVLRLQTHLHIIGRTDGIGDPEQNARLASQRTRGSAAFLRDLGVNAAVLEEHPTPTHNQDGVSTPQLRRVEFRLELRPAQAGS